MAGTDVKRFDLVFESTARASGKMRNDIRVDWPAQNESFDLATDEGPFHGGEGTAPPPLALFTAALTGCLMTQIRAFAKRLEIPVGVVEVQARLHWQAEQIGHGPYTSAPVAFDLDVDLDSPAAEADQMRLLEAAKHGCFIETTLMRGLPVGHRLRIGADWKKA